MFSKSLKSEFLDKIAKEKTIETVNKSKECYYQGIDLVCSLKPSENEVPYIALFIYIIQLFLFALVFIISFCPYLLNLIPVFIFYFSLETKNILIFLISFINIIFSLLSFSGIRGGFVKGCCCGICCTCLYHPSNWALFIVLIDLFTLILDIIIGTFGIYGPEEYKYLIFSFIHIAGVLYNLYRQICLYILFKKIYKTIREEETIIIKKCIEELLKEKDYNIE